MYGVMSGAVVQLDNACLLSFFDWPVKNEHKISWHDLDWPVKDEHKITWHDLDWPVNNEHKLTWHDLD